MTVLERAPASAVAAVSAGRAARWASRSAAAVADQAATALSTLYAHVLLARWMAPAEYGAFALGFVIFSLAATAHNALVIEPMSILGPSRYADRLHGYLRAMGRVHLRVTLLPGAALVAAGLIVRAAGSTPAWGGIAGAGVAIPAVLWLWTVRRARYVRAQPGSALASSVVQLSAVAIALPALTLIARPTPFAAYCVLACAALLAAGCLTLGAPRRAAGEDLLPSPRSLLREHLAYGRYMAGASVVSLTGTQIQLVIVAATMGLHAAGALRALQLFVQPATQAMTALAALALPVMSADAGAGRLAAVREKGRTIGATLVCGAAVYTLALWVFRAPLERLVFGGKFAAYAWLIPVLAAAAIFGAATTGASLVLRAAQRPRHYVVAAVVTAPAGIASAAVMTPMWGVAGAAVSIVIASAATTVVAWLMERRWIGAAS